MLSTFTTQGVRIKKRRNRRLWFIKVKKLLI